MRETSVMHVRAIVCIVLYDGRALTTVARLHRMNIKYKRYRSKRGRRVFVLSPFALPLALRLIVYIFAGRVIAHERCTPTARGQEPRIIAIIIVSVCNGISMYRQSVSYGPFVVPRLVTSRCRWVKRLVFEGKDQEVE